MLTYIEEREELFRALITLQANCLQASSYLIVATFGFS